MVIIDNPYEYVSTKIIALNECGLEKQCTHDKTLFSETMIDGIYHFDNEVINIFVGQCSKLIIENRNNDYHQIFQDTSGDNDLVNSSSCKLDEKFLRI